MKVSQVSDNSSNIIMLLQEYYPKDTRVRKEAQTLIESGNKVSIICLRDDNEPYFENVSGVQVYRINIPKKRGSKLRYIFEYFSFFTLAFIKLNNLVKVEKFDIVHVHNLPDFLVFASYPAKKRGAKVILDMHEIMPEFFVSKYNIPENHIIIKIFKLIEKLSLRYADYVITVNNQIKDKFLSRAKLKNDITIIMNTVDSQTLPKLPKSETNKFIAIYHGTITKVYNLEFAIRSISKVIDKIPDFEFHIYGDGTEVTPLKELVNKLNLNNKVIFKGKVPHSVITEVLSESKLGILPIKKDIMTNLSFSNKLAEYVHYEIPVLSSNLDSVMDYFSNECIYYYNDNDEKDFCDKLLNIYNNYHESSRYVENASKINEEISWNIMRERLKQLVSNVRTSNAIKVLLISSVFSLIASNQSYASSTYYGDSGYFSTPSAEYIGDRYINIGYGYLPKDRSYVITSNQNNIYSIGMGFFPKVEVGINFNQVITGYPDVDNPYLKDSAFDRSIFIKFQALEETDFIPALSIGGRDLFSNTAINYRGNYVTANQQTFYGVVGKTFYDFKFNLGYAYSPAQPIGTAVAPNSTGQKIVDNSFKLNGVFGAIRSPKLFSLISGIIEYDSKYFNYGVEIGDLYGLSAKIAMIDIKYPTAKLNWNHKL